MIFQHIIIGIPIEIVKRITENIFFVIKMLTEQ